MENVLFSNLKKLYDTELYSCVIPVASLLATVYQNDRLTASPEQEYQVLLFRGDSYYHERKFRLAATHLHSALTMRKTLLRRKNPSFDWIENTYDQFTEVEIKYRLAVCYRELNDSNLAISTLQSIPSKSRQPKINMLLAKLQHRQSRNPSEAITAYKDVLRDCPMAMEAISSLLEIGVDGIEVNSLVMNVSSAPKNVEWLSSWIKGHAQMYVHKHLEASKTFQSINDNPKLHQNDHILTLIGKSLYYNGHYVQAQTYLETAHMISPYNTEHIMPLAVIYERNNNLAELEKLASQQSNINEFCSENWCVMAQSLSANGKYEKASYFTHKAISVDPTNVEAYLLRGKIFLQLKRFKEAIHYYRTVQSLANYRFEIYKGLAGCYIGLKRLKDAQTISALAARYFRNCPRSYVLLASTLLYSSNSVTKRQAKTFINRALEIDQYYFPAVSAMSDILQSEGETQEAIKLLKKQAASYPSCKLFTMLGDILSTEKDLDGALEYYTIALSMEPTNHRALEGVNALGQASETTTKQDECSLATTSQDEEWPIDYDEPSIEAVEFSSTAAANPDGESESDPIWSDVDAELTA